MSSNSARLLARSRSINKRWAADLNSNGVLAGRVIMSIVAFVVGIFHLLRGPTLQFVLQLCDAQQKTSGSDTGM